MLYSSLAEQSEKDFTVYFVDNNTDNSDTLYSEELNKKFNLNIIYCSSGGNIGFAGGNNLGAAKAISDGSEYIFFLNNDTILDKDCLRELTAALKNDNNAAAAAPLILFWNGSKTKERVQEFGAAADFNSYRITKMYEGINYNEAELPEAMPTDVLPGAATFIRAGALKNTGLWEESYFAYGDEIDLGKRIQAAGFKCTVNKNAVLWHNHKWDKENKQGYYFEYYLIQRNKYLYFRRYGLYFNMLIAYLTDSLKFPFRLLWFIKVCDLKLGWYYIKGTYAGIFGHKGKPRLNFLK
jgi:GT2 family glycosyltransferase